MKKQLTALCILSALTTAALAADTPPAQTAPARGEPLFVQADADQDGKLSADEFAGLQALGEARAKERQASIPSFEALDTQKRGFVTQEQLRVAHRAQREAAGQDDRGYGRHGRDGAHHGKGRGSDGKPLFAQADKDDNGQLTKAEYQELLKLREARFAERQAARPDFKTLDKNQDGFVTPDEMRAAHRGLRNKV